MTSSITTIVVVDTETTDLDPREGAEVMEIGYAYVVRPYPLRDWQVAPYGSWQYTETVAPVSPVARATHHIDPACCLPGAVNCVPLELVTGAMMKAAAPGGTYFAAHNAPFDWAFLGDQLTLPVVDTLQCARHIWPGAPRHSNQVLRYWLGAEPPAELLAGLEAHRALYDAACTGAILVRMLDLHSPEELLAMSTRPLLLQKCGFGKHKDVPWAEVPRDYLSWMVRSSDMYQTDVNLRHTVDHYLGR